ncbi:MAG: copper amine oxidase N-terminal domain-containing protein [Clostridiales bacterium]|jgi:hypothetical protein|nr:copper amine oxidase N-terminal domain-containing protein [Clostridiales bacterium]
MKKLLTIPLIFALAFSAVPVYAATSGDPEYTCSAINDSQGMTDSYSYKFRTGEIDAAPGQALLLINGSFLSTNIIINNDRSLVPVRFIAETFGAKVDWNESEQSVSIKDGATVITMKIGKSSALVNAKAIELEAPPMISDSRTYVPLRFVAESLKKEVGYIQASPESKGEYFAIEAAKSGIAYNPVIWIDNPATLKSPDDLLASLKADMTQGANAFKKEIKTVNNGLHANLSDEIVSNAIKEINQKISEMEYISQIGRYAMFKGPYVILADITAGNVTYAFTIAHGLGNLRKVDFKDPESFVPMHFSD